MTKSKDATPCPHCDEAIHPAAVICPRCRKSLAAREPAHHGSCPFCRESVGKSALECRHCGSDISITPPVPAHYGKVATRRVVRQDTPSVAPGSVAFARAGTTTGPVGGGGGFFGRTRCFKIPLIECTYTEEVDPIAGYQPPVLQECHIVWVEICVWSPF
jgi:hypothetical protein